MKIISQDNIGWKGFYGIIGTPTNMFDSFGAPLFVGDLVVIVAFDSYDGKYTEDSLWMSSPLSIVCEEDHRFVAWTKEEKQFVMGIGSKWNNNKWATIDIDFRGNYWNRLKTKMDGFAIQKVKDWKDLIDGEKLPRNLYVQEIEPLDIEDRE